jgi:hypothetical protein
MQIKGTVYTRSTIQSAIAKADLKPEGVTANGTIVYDLDKISAAIDSHNAGKLNKQTPSLNALREEKIKEEIGRLKQEKVRADLEIKELKSKLIDSEEVRQFLLLRFGTENALLRRILFVNAPVDLAGVEIPKARKICEDYFNSMQDVLSETLLLWQNKNIDNDSSIPPQIQSVIDRLNKALEVKDV